MNKIVIEQNEGATGYRMTIMQGGVTIFDRLYDVSTSQGKEAYKQDEQEHIGGGGIKRPI